MGNHEKCRLVRLKIDDFMAIEALEIPFGDDPVTRLCGPNAVGKSSVLRAIEFLFRGGKAAPEKPIRDGSSAAEIVAELNTGLTVKRRITAKGTRLEVTAKDGARYDSPQAMLDALLNSSSIDPVGFLLLPEKEQAEQLRQIVGLDFAPLDAARKATYDSRTAVGRDVTRLTGQLAGMPAVEAPDDEVSAADLMAEQQRRSEAKAANESRRAELARQRAAYASIKSSAAEAAREAEALEVALTEARARAQQLAENRDRLETEGKDLAAEVAALSDPDLGEIPAQMRQLEATNAAVRANRERARVGRELSERMAEQARLTAEIERIDLARTDLLAGATFPVPGLSFSPEGGIVYEGQPFSQASDAQRLRVSMGVALSRGGELKIVGCRNASLLDRQARTIIHEMAAEAGARVVLEIVREGEAGIAIEEGIG